MDVESLGGGAVSGLVSSILTLMGWNRRLNRLEEMKAEKTDLAILQRQIDVIIIDQKDDRKYIRERLDMIYEKLSGIK